uniref:Cytochrome P450 6QB1 n=1 Tax=Maconellicoccus hirsutus TaxID=177089 RepID=A0AAT9UTH0_MACHI
MTDLSSLITITNFIGLITTIIILSYFYLKKCYQYWEDRKVPYVKPTSLLFGSNLDLVLQRTSFQEYHADLYKQLAPHRFGGYYNFQRPFLLVRDPEIVKHILVVDFAKFSVRHTDADGSEPLRMHLFNLKGDTWKLLKEKISPAFSPAKIKAMVELMKECAIELVDVLKKPSEDQRDIFITDIISRYGTDVIGTCAFGYQAHSLLQPDAIFRTMARRIIEPHFNFKLRSLLLAISPKLCRIFKVRMFDPEATQYFIDLVDETIKYRESNNIVRNDFIDLLIAVKREEHLANQKDKNRSRKMDVSVENLAAQCFAFFFAGYSTQNLTLGAALLELARNPDVQRKLRQEIDDTFAANNGEINYDILNKMKYMEQVVSEVIRCYPGQPIILRQCGENYKIPDSDTVIEKGVTVFVPRYGLNHDPEYYPDPDTFDPEHFSDEAKAARHPYAHLLFGEGPRKCLGTSHRISQSYRSNWFLHTFRTKIWSNAFQTRVDHAPEELRVYLIS